MSLARSSFPAKNTTSNGLGGTTTIIGNTMIVTGYFVGTTPYLTVTYPTYPAFTATPVISALCSNSSDNAMNMFVSLAGPQGLYDYAKPTTTGFTIDIFAGTGAYNAGGSYNLMFTAIGPI